MRSVRITDDAAQEAAEAMAWYEGKWPGLGTDFSQAVERALDVLEENIVPLQPLRGKSGAQGAKRLILKRFPYDIVAVERNGEVVVVAVAHHSRKPGYWRKRLG